MWGRKRESTAPRGHVQAWWAPIGPPTGTCMVQGFVSVVHCKTDVTYSVQSPWPLSLTLEVLMVDIPIEIGFWPATYNSFWPGSRRGRASSAEPGGDSSTSMMSCLELDLGESRERGEDERKDVKDPEGELVILWTFSTQDAHPGRPWSSWALMLMPGGLTPASTLPCGALAPEETRESGD